MVTLYPIPPLWVPVAGHDDAEPQNRIHRDLGWYRLPVPNPVPVDSWCWTRRCAAPPRGREMLALKMADEVVELFQERYGFDDFFRCPWASLAT